MVGTSVGDPDWSLNESSPERGSEGIQTPCGDRTSVVFDLFRSFLRRDLEDLSCVGTSVELQPRHGRP